ncbi:amidohydrolase family protein [Phenylobacterium sp.]|uniref:amidohydrolase family protein n=1 Tax=Phenylobacterium sp. TaxID=1871053 RepID=UPI0035B24DCB
MTDLDPTTPTRRIASPLAALMGLLIAWFAWPACASAEAILIRDVRMLDFSGPTTEVTPHASVLVDGDRIVAVGPVEAVEAPAGARIVEGAGRTLTPGLTDMHVHIWDEGVLGAYLSYGVTTVRNASGMAFNLAMRDAVAAGELEGPRIITTGPILNGHGPNAQIHHMLVDTPDQARAAVRWQHAAGFRRLKLYSNLSRPAYEAIRQEAEALDMTIMGHPVEGVREPGMPHDKPFNIAFEELLDDGFVTIEHMESIVWHGLRDELDEGKARALARKIAASGTPVDPTLLAYYSLLRTAQTKGAYLERPGTEMLNPFVHAQEGAERERWSGEDAQAAARYFAFYQRATKIFAEEGVTLVAGTDAGIFVNIPGKSLETELGLLTGAGLSPHQALQAATWNPAVVLDEADRTGRIAPGYRADLLLLAEDPLADATAAARPDAVVAGGRFYSAQALAALRQGARPSLERTQKNLMAGLAAQAAAF